MVGEMPLRRYYAVRQSTGSGSKHGFEICAGDPSSVVLQGVDFALHLKWRVDDQAH